jgi:putative transferase (TIGR04331 family)
MNQVTLNHPENSVSRLWLGQVGSDFNWAKDATLGPWCFQGAENICLDWESRNFDDPLDSGEEIAEAACKVQNLVNALVPELTAQFNQRHDTNYGLAYWRMLLVPWLIYVLSALYRRLIHIEHFVDLHRDQAFEVQVAGNEPLWQLQDMPDLWERFLNSHDFNFWLGSEIVKLVKPEAWTLLPVALDFSPPKSITVSHRSAWSSRAAEYIDDLRCRRVPGMRYWALPFSALLALLPAKEIRSKEISPDLNEAKSHFSPIFLALMDHVLQKLCPAVLAENFDAMDKAAAKQKYRPGKVTLVGPVLCLNEEQKFKLAHAAEAGELIVCSQHGGQGYQKLPLPLVETEYKQDAYFTWGWSEQEDHNGKFVPVPSPLFSRYKDQHVERNDNLYLVGNAANPFSQRLQTTEIQGRHCLSYRQEKTAFIESLPPEILKTMVYRPYPDGPGILSDGDYYRQFYPALKIADENVSHRGLIQELLACRLVLADHPVTIFSLALAANIPVIGMWREESWPLARQAYPIFKQLKSAGIIYHNGTEAAAKLAETWDDVQAWWQTETVQSARQNFVRNYARTSPVWWWYWARALTSL